MLARFAAVVVLLTPGAVLAATHIRVQPAPAGDATVLLCDNDACAGTPTILPVRAGEATAEIPAGRSAFVTVVAEGYWAPVVRVGSASAEVVLIVQPASRITGVFTPGRGASPPSHVRIEVQSPPTTSSPVLAKITASCSVHAMEWSCRVPALPLDIRLLPEGYAPQYFWGVVPPAGASVAIGPVRLERGGSVSGWVAPPQGVLPKDIRVQIAPREYVPDERAANSTVTPNERGFFQLTGVPRGVYALNVLATGFARTTAETRVDEGVETRLERTLTLQPLAQLIVIVDPPQALDGEPWWITLRRLGNEHEKALDESVARTGTWTHRGLEPGPYWLTIGSHVGVLHAQSVELSSDPTPVRVTISQVPVRGRLAMGDQPVEGMVTFQAAGARVSMEADADGRFVGSLAHEGKWRLSIAPKELRVRLRARAVDVRRPDGAEYARVDVTLPASHLRGIVVNEAGTPVPNAAVLVSQHNDLVANTATDTEGTFAIGGIEPGEVVLEAADGNAESGPVPFTVDAAGPTSARLVLAERVAVRGMLVDRRGAAVPGALIRYTGGMEGLSEAHSGPDGEFSFTVPRSTKMVDAVIIAPGLAVKLLALVPLREAQEIVMENMPARLTVLLAGAPPWPYIRRAGGFLALPLLLRPREHSGPPPEYHDGAFSIDVDPGAYVLCAKPEGDVHCKAATLQPGAETTLDARAFWPAAPAGGAQ